MSNYTRRINQPAVTPANTIAVPIGAVPALSAAIPADSVRLCGTSACYVTFGAAPVASAASMYLPADAAEIFQFVPGELVSVLQLGGGGGTLYITWGN